MKSTDRSSVRVWVFDCWACWSMACAAGPVRWRTRPGGAPADAMAVRTALMVLTASGEVDADGIARLTTALRARPSDETP